MYLSSLPSLFVYPHPPPNSLSPSPLHLILSLQDSGLSDGPNKEVQILIPQPFMGTIIGTGGAKIKDLRSVSEKLVSSH